MRTYPLYPERSITDLNGIWQFRFLEKTFLEDADEESFTPNDVMCVPGAFDATPAYRCKRGTGLYRREFRLWKDSPRGILKVGAIGLRARFRIDGKEVGFTNLPYSGVQFETGPLKAGVHVITAAIDNNFDRPAVQYAAGDRMKLFLPYYDFYAFGGFYRGIELHQLPSGTILDRVQVRTLSHETGRVALRFLFSGACAEKRTVRFRFDTDSDYRTAEIAHGETLECTVPAFRLWSCEKPELHTLEVRTQDDVIVERFGIRTVQAGKRQILLNGKPVYLKGFNRHESHPEFGPATPEAVMLEDLQNLRDLHCNFVRGCHYSQDPRFLDFCDEYGMLVWEESLGWGNTAEQMADPEFQDLVEEETRLMIRNSINHPSVIFWAFLNEFHSHSPEGRHLCERLVKAVKEEDDSRLVTFASCHPNDDICSDLLDVVAYNIYPGWIGDHLQGVEPPDEIPPMQKKTIAYYRSRTSPDKPIMVSEMGCCGIYGQRDLAKTQWSEEFQAEYVSAVIRTVASAGGELCGLTIWQFTDAMSFHRTGQDIRCKPLGLNLAGVFDKYRRRKLAADAVKELYEKL